MEHFSGRVAVVTGASSGLGRSLAWKCAREGMKVVMASIDQGRVEQAALDLCADIPQAVVLPVAVDVSKAADMEALAQKAWDTFGGVHLLVNNAGVGDIARAWEYSAAEWEWTMGVNFWGVVHAIRLFVPRMLAQGEEGHVVNMGSVASVRTSPWLAAYCASKYAIFSLSEGLYYDLAQVGARIGVSVVCPSFVRSGLAEAYRNAPPEIANRPVTPEQQVVIDGIRQAIENGADPDELADHVIEAVRRRQLYVFPYPEDLEWVRERMEDVLHQRNPEV